MHCNSFICFIINIEVDKCLTKCLADLWDEIFPWFSLFRCQAAEVGSSAKRLDPWKGCQNSPEEKDHVQQEKIWSGQKAKNFKKAKVNTRNCSFVICPPVGIGWGLMDKGPCCKVGSVILHKRC